MVLWPTFGGGQAYKAGGAEASKCTLILTEGDSAKVRGRWRETHRERSSINRRRLKGIRGGWKGDRGLRQGQDESDRGQDEETEQDGDGEEEEEKEDAEVEDDDEENKGR